MKKTLKVLNDMLEMGLIEQYAIGGGIAVLYIGDRIRRTYLLSNNTQPIE